MAKKKKAAPQGARVLFDQLIGTNRVGDLFHICKRSGDYTVCNVHTLEFTRALVRDLSRLLAEHDAEQGIPPPMLEDIELSLVPEGVRWRAQIGGNWGPHYVANWKVAEAVRDFLYGKLPPEGITPLPCSRAARGAH